MTGPELAAAADLLREAAARLRDNSSGLDSVDVIAELAVTRESSRLVAQIQVEPSQCCSAAGRSPLPDISDPSPP